MARVYRKFASHGQHAFAWSQSKRALHQDYPNKYFHHGRKSVFRFTKYVVSICRAITSKFKSEKAGGKMLSSWREANQLPVELPHACSIQLFMTDSELGISCEVTRSERTKLMQVALRASRISSGGYWQHDCFDVHNLP